MAREASGRNARYGAGVMHQIAYFISPPSLNVQQVLAWRDKTNYLSVALSDLPEQLAKAHAASAGPGESHSETDVRFYDAVPALRLAMALEFTSHIVYSLTEVAANVANKASAGGRKGLPASFNAIRKAVDAGTAPEGLAEALGDLSWYKKIREMRTEWAHYSAPFVTARTPPAQFRVYAERPPSERKHLHEPALFTFDEFVQALRGAVHATEGLAHHVIVAHVLPKLDPATTQPYIKRTSDGVPVIRDNRMVIEHKTIGDLLGLCGIPQ